MNCQKKDKLPPPPSGKTGWPWTEESQQLPENIPDGSPWPRISIVTPSYNQGQFLEETIRSILLQGYPNLEYIIIDGGSTDNSVEIIKKYEKWISFWVSEKDRGQAHAINKGWLRTSGEVLGWLNSDDILEPGALNTIGGYFSLHRNKYLLIGNCISVDVNRCPVGAKQLSDYSIKRLLCGCNVPQPAAFFRKEILETVGFLNEDLNYALDFDLFVRIFLEISNDEFFSINETLAESREYVGTKCTMGGEDFRREYLETLKKWSGAIIGKCGVEVYSDALVQQALFAYEKKNYRLTILCLTEAFLKDCRCMVRLFKRWSPF